MTINKLACCRECTLRDTDGQCIPLKTPCNNVAVSLCAPLQDAFETGREAELYKGHAWLEVYGVCPFCYGEPTIHKPGRFAKVFLHEGRSIVCSRCGARLVTVHTSLVGEALRINILQNSVKLD